MTNGKNRHICIVFVESLNSILKYRFSMAILGYLLPFLLIFGISIVAIFKKKEELKNKEMILYPIIFGSYFFATSFYIELFDLAFFFFDLKVNIGVNFIMRILFTGCSIVNMVACFYVDPKFFKRCMQFLRLSSPNAVVSYKNFKQENDGTFTEFENNFDAHRDARVQINP